jgi:hypothetical protein
VTDYLTSLANLRFFVEDPFYTGPIRAGECLLVRRSSPPKLLEGAYVARVEVFVASARV